MSKFLFRNDKEVPLKMYIEPSTDELWLKPGEVLMMDPKYEVAALFEIEYCSNGDVVVWIPHGQSADVYIDDKLIETICSLFVW